MIFTLPAIYYTLNFKDSVADLIENENTSSSKSGEKAEFNKFNKIKNSKDPQKR
jgi:hypothetical protein